MIGLIAKMSFAIATLGATSLNQVSINAVPPGGTLDLSAVNAPVTITATLKFTSPIKVTNCHVQVNCQTGKGGTCMAVQTDNFSFVAKDRSCVITQAQQADQPIAFNLGSHQNAALKNFKLDWNEDNQDVQGYYYTPIASNFSGFNGGQTVLNNVVIDNVEITRGGQRGIDLRGARNVSLTNSWFHQTGVNVGGNVDPAHASAGNSVSIGIGQDKNGPIIFSQNTVCSGNLVEEQGDSFRCGDTNVTLTNNTVYGPAWFGHQPWGTSGGFDLDGITGLTGSGNSVYDVYSASAWLIPLCYGMNSPDSTCSTGTFVPTVNVTLTGDYFYSGPEVNQYGCRGSIGCEVPASADIQLGTTFYTTPQENITLTNETFVGTVVSVQNVANWSITGSLDGYASTYFPAALEIWGPANNTFTESVTILNHDGGLKDGVFVNSDVNGTPCTLGPNQIDPSIPKPYYYYQNHDPGCIRH
jgi:hypothetical protein